MSITLKHGLLLNQVGGENRLTQEVVEVLRDGDPSSRITQEPVEVLRDGDPSSRITQEAVEVVRSNTVSFATDFSEYTSDAEPSDWTNTWNPTYTLYTVRDSLGTDPHYGNKYLEVDGVSKDYNYIAWDKVGLVTDVEILMRFIIRYNVNDHSVGVAARISDVVASGNAYTVFFNPYDDYYRLQRRVSGSGATIQDFYPSFGIHTAQYYWFRFQVIGSNLKTKMWRERDGEPSGWDCEQTDTNIVGDGAVGLMNHDNDTNTDIDYFAVGSGVSPVLPDLPPNEGDIIITQNFIEVMDTGSATIRNTQAVLNVMETGNTYVRGTLTYLDVVEKVDIEDKSDNFVGTDESIPNTDKWIVDKYTGNETTVDIKDNSLRIKIDGGNAKDEKADLKPKYKFDSNFDIVVDYDINGSTDIDSWSFGLDAILNKSQKDGVGFGIARTYNSTDGHEYTFWYESGSVAYAETTVSSSETSGTIRIRRVGNDIYGYFWNGTDWTQVGTYNNAEFNLSAVVSLTNNSKNSYPDIDVSYTNFEIMSGEATDYWCWHNDIFSGINGSIPNSDKWTVTEPSNVSLSIQDNQLEIKHVSQDANQTGSIKSDYLFTDFDVQVDFEIVSSDSSNDWDAGIMCYQSNGWYSGIYRSYNGAANNYYAYRYNGTLADTNVATSDDSGKLRFVRSGTTWTWYYWNSTTEVWTQLRTEAITSGDADMAIYILVESNTNYPDVNVLFDNFYVNSGCPTQPPEYTYGRPHNMSFIKI